MADQLPFQGPASLHEQASIDRLVRHPQLRVLRIFGFQPTCDLLRSPILLQLTCNELLYLLAFGEQAELCSPRRVPGFRVGFRGPIAASSPMSADLLTYGGRRPVQPSRDGANALARSNATGDLFAFNKAQYPRRASPYGPAPFLCQESTRRSYTCARARHNGSP